MYNLRWYDIEVAIVPSHGWWLCTMQLPIESNNSNQNRTEYSLGNGKLTGDVRHEMMCWAAMDKLTPFLSPNGP